MAVDDEGSSFFVRDDEDLAKRYEALSDDKKKLFDQHLEIKTDYRQQELPPYYREVLLTTLEKNLPDRAQGIEIADLRRHEEISESILPRVSGKNNVGTF